MDEFRVTDIDLIQIKKPKTLTIVSAAIGAAVGLLTFATIVLSSDSKLERDATLIEGPYAVAIFGAAGMLSGLILGTQIKFSTPRTNGEF